MTELECRLSHARLAFYERFLLTDQRCDRFSCHFPLLFFFASIFRSRFALVSNEHERNKTSICEMAISSWPDPSPSRFASCATLQNPLLAMQRTLSPRFWFFSNRFFRLRWTIWFECQRFHNASSEHFFVCLSARALEFFCSFFISNAYLFRIIHATLPRLVLSWPNGYDPTQRVSCHIGNHIKTHLKLNYRRCNSGRHAAVCWLRDWPRLEWSEWRLLERGTCRYSIRWWAIEEPEPRARANNKQKNWTKMHKIKGASRGDNYACWILKNVMQWKVDVFGSLVQGREKGRGESLHHWSLPHTIDENTSSL